MNYVYKTIIIFIIIIIIIVILYYKNACPNLDTSYINKNPLKCCILLTMYIGGDKNKRDVYLHRISRWLNETSFYIYTVESSGEILNINHERLKQFTFIQTDFGKGNSTILERNSILKAFNYFKNDFKKYDIIFKITAKYFIPSLKSIIKHIPPNTELLIQYTGSDIFKYQNTEITGYKYSIMYDITKNINNKEIYESQMSNIYKKYKTYRLPVLKLEEFTQRGDGSILKYL